MHIRHFLIFVSILLSSSVATQAQQTQSSGTAQPQAATLLARSAAALSGSAALSDVTLTGTAHLVAGSDDEIGTVTLKAMAAGQSRMDLTLASSTRSEVASPGTPFPQGAWSGSDGVQHAISNHNLLTDSSWFFPALTLARIVSTPGTISAYVGQETMNGQPVLHVSVSRQFTGGSVRTLVLLQQLSQMELYLDPNTFLPVALSFNTHPDDNSSLNIPVQIQFSNYQSVGGVHIPYHAQKFLNGSLLLDLQIQSATLNSGLSASAFAIQVAQ